MITTINEILIEENNIEEIKETLRQGLIPSLGNNYTLETAPFW